MVQQSNAIEKYIEYSMPPSPETHQSFFFHFPPKAITLISSLCVFPEILIVNTIPSVCAKSLQLCPTFCSLWTVAHQAPLSMGFPRQEY